MRKPVKNKIKILPDSKYNSVRVAKFINCVTKRGKKNIARKNCIRIIWFSKRKN